MFMGALWRDAPVRSRPRRLNAAGQRQATPYRVCWFQETHSRTAGEALTMIRFLATALLLIPAPVRAHTMLEDATPAAGSRVARPSQVRLVFDNNISPAASSVAIEGPAGFGGVARIASPNGYTLIVSLRRPVPAGRYRVRWRATSSSDRHVNKGDFAFEVRP
jgi:methionine-rich copper-binding protein CopC